MAAANLRIAMAGLPVSLAEAWVDESRVLVTDAAQFSVSDISAWHLDPDRRPSGVRTTHVEWHEPGPAGIAHLRNQCPNGAIKLAPAATVDDSRDGRADRSTVIPWAEGELEWISRKRQCRQLVVWFGSLAQTSGERRATLLTNERSAADENLVVASFAGLPGVELRVAHQIGRFILEPDPSVLAANLQGALAGENGLQAVAAGVGYLTADEPRGSPLLVTFEVLDVMPYRPRSVKSWLRSRGMGRLEVKKRGVDLDPARVQRDLHVPGDNAATILLCRMRGKATAILARRT
jgi:hypothetical protein